jgi:hypothetical protein
VVYEWQYEGNSHRAGDGDEETVPLVGGIGPADPGSWIYVIDPGTIGPEDAGGDGGAGLGAGSGMDMSMTASPPPVATQTELPWNVTELMLLEGRPLTLL